MHLPPHLPTYTDEDIRTKLHNLKEEFFSALQTGNEALATLNSSWDAFSQMVFASHKILAEDTISMIYSFVNLSNTIVPALLEIDTAGNVIHEQLEKDITTILEKNLDQFSLEDSAEDISDDRNHTPYIQPAYRWLMNNLHNPYPSKEIRAAIACEAGKPQKAVDAWFTDVRRQIGWNALRKEHFPRRADMVKAATTFFALDDCQVRTGGHEPQFMQIRTNAVNLYLGKYSNGDEGTGTTTTCTKLSPGRSRTRRRKASISAYPSPPRTDTSTERPCSSSDRGRKRRLSSQDIDEAEIEQGPGRKRARLLQSWRPPLAIDVLPSPAPTESCSDTEEDTESPGSVTPFLKSERGLPSVGRGGKRKRQLSDADSIEAKSAAKRCHNLPVQELSPQNTLLDDSPFQFMSGIPPPVTALSFDEAAPVELEYFNYDPSPFDVISIPFSLDSSLDLLENSVTQRADSEDKLVHHVSMPQTSVVVNDPPSFFDLDLMTGAGDSSSSASQSCYLPHFSTFDHPTQAFSINGPASTYVSHLDWAMEMLINVQHAAPFPALETKKSTVLGDFNSNARITSRVPCDYAKRERVRILREELQRLEANLVA